MKALTVRQPWASAIAYGPKRVENRTMRTRYRGPLAIHASRGWSRRGMTDERIRAWHATPTIEPVDFPRGLILAVCELTDCHPAQGDCCQPWGEQQYEDSTGRIRRDIWHWLLEDVEPINPLIAAPGRLGLWTLDPASLHRAPLPGHHPLTRTVPNTTAR